MDGAVHISSAGFTFYELLCIEGIFRSSELGTL
jgi:hypothetical protein